MEYNEGLREDLDTKDAMFTNSLFCDFLLDNGLKVEKDESTKDLICVLYSYGMPTFEEELKRLRNKGREVRQTYRDLKRDGDLIKAGEAEQLRKKISGWYRRALDNRDRFHKESKEKVRIQTYNNGISVRYVTRRKNGQVVRDETIHYQMLYRSTGKAKAGNCMFICDRLYKKAHKFLYMGIRVPKRNAPIVELSAYVPLVSSTIIDRIHIEPENILILQDVDRYFSTNVISIETDKDRHCYTRHLEDYELKNTLFDGQALIDSSVFPKWGNGYILLRHHFCKMAAFNTDIQKFYRDYFGKDYENATVTDMFGKVHFVKDVKVITTNNSMKWIKFGKDYDYWCSRVHENNDMFGIVKTGHASKYGEVQKMSYQMVNSLDESIMPQVVDQSVKYVESLKRDDNEFLNYLEMKKGFAYDYDVLIALVKQDPTYVRCEHFRRRKSNIIQGYIQELKAGRIIQNAENLTVVGSPYAMLLYGATGNPDSVDEDDTFFQEDGAIQCYTERFNSGEYLAFFRSPFNARNNLMYLHNTYCSKLEKYFHLGRQTIAINMIGTDAQDRSNGMDMDSDFGYVTNQPDIVAHAKMCYREYPTIVNNIPKEKTNYTSSMYDFARMDNSLANAQRDIGESSNMAQLAQTYACNFNDPKYADYVCILSVIAQAAIDNAKRRFDIDISGEIKRIKKDMNIEVYGYPTFWKFVADETFDRRRINRLLHCPMNYLTDIKFKQFRPKESTLPMSDFFVRYEPYGNLRTAKRVEALIEKYAYEFYQTDFYKNMHTGTTIPVVQDFDRLVAEIEKLKISKNYLGFYSWLIDRAFGITSHVKAQQDKMDSNLWRNKSLLLKALYDANPKNLLKCFSKNVKD